MRGSCRSPPHSCLWVSLPRRLRPGYEVALPGFLYSGTACATQEQQPEDEVLVLRRLDTAPEPISGFEDVFGKRQVVISRGRPVDWPVRRGVCSHVSDLRHRLMSADVDDVSGHVIAWPAFPF